MNPYSDPRVDPVEANLAAFHAVLTASPFVIAGTFPDVTTYVSGLPHPLFNGAHGARFATGTERDRVPRVAARFIDEGLPFIWWCGPTTWSPGLDRALLALGAHRDDAPGMHVELDGDLEVPGVPGLEIDLRPPVEQVAELMCAGFEIPEGLVEPVRALIAHFDPRMLVNAIGTLDGEPVACGSLLVTDRTAGLYNIATLPGARGRGIGYAVTAALMAGGRARGCTESVLHASEMGAPVYRRLGFVEVCRMPQYVWVPGA